MSKVGFGCLAALICVGLLVPVSRAMGQAGAGLVAGTSGVPEISRGGVEGWQPLLTGAAVSRSDRIRTGADAAVKIVFRDDSVAELGPNSGLVIDDQFMFESDAKRFRSLLRLESGKLHLMVGSQYDSPSARYEVETPTAVVTAHGSEFFVAYDGQGEFTDVVNMNREIVVRGKLGVIGPGAKIGAQEWSRVSRGRFPSPSQGVDESVMAQFRQRPEALATEQVESFVAGHRLLAGKPLRIEDRPETISGTRAVTRDQGDDVEPWGAGESVAEHLSPDICAVTQPILEFRATNPGERPAGGIHLGF